MATFCRAGQRITLAFLFLTVESFALALAEDSPKKSTPSQSGSRGAIPGRAGHAGFSGGLVVGFKTINLRGDLNNFREDAGERAGLTLQSFTSSRQFQNFAYVQNEALFTSENASRVRVELGLAERFSLRLNLDRIQSYYETSSTNPSSLSQNFATLPGDLTLRRSVGSVDWAGQLHPRLRLGGGYRLRRSNGNDLQLIGGSYFTTLDASLPTQQGLSTTDQSYYLEMDASLAKVGFHLNGEIENLRSTESFLLPQINGFALNRDVAHTNATFAHIGSFSASVDATPSQNLFFSGGYVFTDLRNNPQWSRVSLERKFESTTRRGDSLHAESQFNTLFAQALYVPQPRVSVRYRMVQTWGDGQGNAMQLRYENPFDLSLTESLRSQTSFDSAQHREQVSASLYGKYGSLLRVSYDYDRRERNYRDFFTPSGLDFTAGAHEREGVQKARHHTVALQGRLHPSKGLEFLGAFARKEESVRENFKRLVRKYYLGDRELDSDQLRAGARYRPGRRLALEFDYRHERRNYSVLTSLANQSENSTKFDTYSAQMGLHPTDRWFVYGLMRYTTVDGRPKELSRKTDFVFYAPIEYLTTNTGFSLGTSYMAFDRVTLGVQFQQNRAGGTESYLLHSAAASIEYDLEKKWSLGCRYQFFESREVFTRMNNYHAHLVQGLLYYKF